MKSVLYIMVCCIALAACQKNNEQDSPTELNGVYTGTFNRTGFTDTASVTLDLEINRFSGQSNKLNYPAICRGSFEQAASTISFVDSCAWTANFDWTLILNGTYSISFQTDQSIRIWRTNGVITDEYLLRRMVR